MFNFRNDKPTTQAPEIDAEQLTSSLDETFRPSWEPSPAMPIAYQAILQLDGACDGAIDRDDVGFNGPHARFGKWISNGIRDGWILKPEHIERIFALLPTYRNTQLQNFAPFWKEMYEQKPHLLAQSHKYFAEKQEKQREIENMPQNEFERLFLLLDSDLCGKDEDFISSLQSSLQKYGRLTGPQERWARKMLERWQDEALPTGGVPLGGNVQAGRLTLNNPVHPEIAKQEFIEDDTHKPANIPTFGTGTHVNEPAQQDDASVQQIQQESHSDDQKELEHTPSLSPFTFGFGTQINKIPPEPAPVEAPATSNEPIPLEIPDEPEQAIAEIERVTGVTEEGYVDGVITFQRGGQTLSIELDDSQKQAVEGVLRQQFAGITGAAGTGKTTVTRVVVDQLEQQHNVRMIDIGNYGLTNDHQDYNEQRVRHVPAIAFAAYTGRAMQQMKKALPETYHARCFTIHKLLGFHPIFEEYEDEETGEMKTKRIFVPLYTEKLKMNWSIIVLDEASMIPQPLWEQFLAACREDCRIILIGDINQLPPIHGRSVMGFAMLKWPFYELTQIHRQKGEDNPIVDNAWRINRGEIPEQVPGRFDMIRVDSSGTAAAITLQKVVKILYGKGEFDPYGTDERAGDIIIVGQNIDTLGQRALNEYFTPYFNPPPATDAEDQETGRRTLVISGYEKRLLAVGDKVMATVNDHDAQVTNGMIGRIVRIVQNGRYLDRTGAMMSQGEILNMMNDLDNLDLSTMDSEIAAAAQTDTDESEDYQKRAASHIITVDFGLHESGERHQIEFQTVGQVNSLQHAYAATCHKCQGSEFDTVIIVVHSSTHRLMFREWLYTAVTRAAKRVVLIYNDRGLSQALNRQRIKGKNLEQKAHAFLQLMDAEDAATGLLKSNVVIPTLPEPREIT